MALPTAPLHARSEVAASSSTGSSVKLKVGFSTCLFRARRCWARGVGEGACACAVKVMEETILGAERKLFFVALIMGAAAFNLFGSVLGGLLVFGSLFLMAQWATRTDPQILRILLNSGKFRRQ